MRFRRQAQAAGRLGHPGIVAVYEYGEDSAAGTTFIRGAGARVDLKSCSTPARASRWSRLGA